MKKLIVAFLAAVMALTLVACGSSKQEPAGSAADGAAAETITIRMCGYDNENTANGIRIAYFQEKLKELSGGVFEFDYYPGGTLCAVFEEYAFLSAGTVDMCFFLPGPNTGNNPWVYGCDSGSTDQDDAAACMRSIYLKDPTCMAIINKYTEKDNIHIFGTENDGGSVCASNFEVKSLADLSKGTNGVTRNPEFYVALGQNVVNIDLSEVYDSLSRGLCDFTFWTACNMVTNKINEVAPYGYAVNDAGVDFVYACTKTFWDGLTAEQQGWIEEAARATEAYSVEYTTEQNAEFAKVFNAAQGSEEDAWTFAMKMNELDAPGMIAIAENLNGEEGKEDMVYLTLYKEAWFDHGKILGSEYDSYREKFGEITVTK